MSENLYKIVYLQHKELNPVIRRWANYFHIANCKGVFKSLMAWIRRRLR
ncbi:MAG TPA: hypothetical protein DDW93_05955, partial [Firmicutes bacterium]|nr:hypothetical protein [Bacillota bacterium]